MASRDLPHLSSVLKWNQGINPRLEGSNKAKIKTLALRGLTGIYPYNRVFPKRRETPNQDIIRTQSER